MRRLIPGLLLFGVLVTGVAACNNDSNTTMTTPTTTTPTPITEPLFTGTLKVNGASVLPFTATTRRYCHRDTHRRAPDARRHRAEPRNLDRLRLPGRDRERQRAARRRQYPAPSPRPPASAFASMTLAN